MQTQLKQVIYVSEITDTSSDSLTAIYDISQKNNSKSGISGCLLIGSNSYLQLLEGQESAVENLYSKIKVDSRHKKVKKLLEQHIEKKLFSSWSMKFAPFNNVKWDNKEFNAGKFQNINAATAVKVFQSIKEMIVNGADKS
ncbi:MAG: BLUF domain-containing protein [Pseudomonadota bacterium]|nr:BLUF domain-containing protein [Pseudomonadota bacterium]